MAASELDTCSIFEPPENIANQRIIPLPMTYFEGVDSVLKESRGPEWAEYTRHCFPITGRAYWAFDRLIYIHRHIKNAPHAPDFTKQTIHILYKGDDFRIAVKGASRMVDKVCHGENGGEEAKRLEDETRRYLIPACIAIIKAVFERAGGPGEGLGGFTQVTLEVVLRALDWIYKLNEAAGDGEERKERLEEALEPLAGGVLAAMQDIRDMEVRNEEGREESRGRDESVKEERDRGETRKGDGGLKEVESTVEESGGVESNGNESDGDESNGDKSDGEESKNRDKGVEEERNDEYESMEEAESMEEEHLLDAYSQSGYEPGLESDRDYSTTTAQATRSNRRCAQRQIMNFSNEVKQGDVATGETETRASRTRCADKYHSPPPPKRPCRRDTSPDTLTESEELPGPKTTLRKGPSIQLKESTKEGPRRSARVKKMQKPKRDSGKLGIPKWVEAPLYTTMYNGIGKGRRVPMSNRRGFLIRDGLGFFAPKDERLWQG